MTPKPSGIRSERGRKARGEGRFAEVLAALLLMAKGYRILGFRLASRQGEIDILALRGRVLAAVEVKRRATIEAAVEAVYPPSASASAGPPSGWRPPGKPWPAWWFAWT